MLKKFKLPRNLTSAVRTYYDTQGALRGNFKHFNFNMILQLNNLLQLFIYKKSSTIVYY